MIIECKNCGAPLDVEQGKWLTTCAYCRVTQRVRKEASIYATPPDWRAPTQWTPPPQRGVEKTFAYDPGQAARKTTMVILLLTLIPVVVPLAAVGVPLLAPLVSNLRWDGSETLVCDGNDRRTISGKKIKAKAEPAIVAAGNCQLTIEDSTLSGEELLEVSGNGRITIVNSKLTIKSRKGISVSGNRGVVLTGGKLRIAAPEGDKAELLALSTDGNANVELHKTTLEIVAGSATATVVVGASDSNGSIVLEDVELTVESDPKPAKVVLFRMTGNGTGKMEGGSIDAAGQRLEVTGRRPSKVDGVELNGSQIVQAQD